MGELQVHRSWVLHNVIYKLRCDFRTLGAGLMEQRIDTGPGYRVYFSQIAIGRCLILCGGSKRTQSADIERTRKWLEEAKRRSSR